MGARDLTTPSLRPRPPRPSTACELDSFVPIYFSKEVGLWKGRQIKDELSGMVCLCASQAGGGGGPGEPIMGHGSCSGDVPEGWQLDPRGTPWGWPGTHEQLSGRECTHARTPPGRHQTAFTHCTDRKYDQQSTQTLDPIQHSCFTFMSSHELPTKHWGHLNVKMIYDLHVVANPSPLKYVSLLFITSV